jgi:hypothetical protein
MKKLILTVLLILCLALPAMAQHTEGLRSSGLKTSDSSVVTDPCLFYGVEIITNGSSDATAIIYDSGTGASGTVVFKGKIAAANNFGGVMYNPPVEMFNGIYLDLDGTSAAVIIYWKNR